MVKYEIKKVFTKTSNQIALGLLVLLIGIAFWLAAEVPFVNEKGENEYGYAAVQKLRAAQKEWAGALDEEKLRAAIAENRRIENTPQAQSGEVMQNNIAYGWKQGIAEIRNLLNLSYAEGFRSYDYYRADRLNEDAADSFYENRIRLLEEWLDEDAAELFSDEEKAYLLRQFENTDTPFSYDYMKGWRQGLEYAPTVIMVAVLILSYLVAGLFSNEFQYRADAVFFSALYGRNKAVSAKIKAGFLIVTILYWMAILTYSAAVFLYFGTDGAGCPIQADFTGWKSFYNLLNWQKYLLTILGGYMGCLFMAFLTMLVSARTRSALPAVITPFILIFLPSFLGNINSPLVNKVLGILPDQLLQIGVALNLFQVYSVGRSVVGAVPILFVLYGILTAGLPPILYRVYRHL